MMLRRGSWAEYQHDLVIHPRFAVLPCTYIGPVDGERTYEWGLYLA